MTIRRILYHIQLYVEFSLEYASLHLRDILTLNNRVTGELKLYWITELIKAALIKAWLIQGIPRSNNRLLFSRVRGGLATWYRLQEWGSRDRLGRRGFFWDGDGPGFESLPPEITQRTDEIQQHPWKSLGSETSQFCIKSRNVVIIIGVDAVGGGGFGGRRQGLPASSNLARKASDEPTFDAHRRPDDVRRRRRWWLHSQWKASEGCRSRRTRRWNQEDEAWKWCKCRQIEPQSGLSMWSIGDYSNSSYLIKNYQSPFKGKFKVYKAC